MDRYHQLAGTRPMPDLGPRTLRIGSSALPTMTDMVAATD